MYHFELDVDKKPELQYGQTIYVIEPDPTKLNPSEYLSFGKCPVCDDKKKISYRGYEIECSYCRQVSTKYIILTKYVLSKYFVNRFRFSGPDFVSSIRSHLPKIEDFCAFTRWGKGYDDIRVREIYPDDLDPSDDKVCKYGEDDVFVFTSKNAAEHALELVIEKQKKLLDEFNKKYGTDYVFPF